VLALRDGEIFLPRISNGNFWVGEAADLRSLSHYNEAPRTVDASTLLMPMVKFSEEPDGSALVCFSTVGANRNYIVEDSLVDAL